jgi:maleate cis-trans isomerase
MGKAELIPWLRVGYISPHPLVDTLPYEFYLMAPDGVMMMAACLEIEDYTMEAVEKQFEILDTRIESLMRRGAGRIVISGVPIAIALGRVRMRSLLAEISDRWKVPADTDLEAIIAGAQHLGVRKAALATRWKQPMNERLTAYLGDAGIDVVEIANSGRSMSENAGLDDESGIKLAIELGAKALGAPGHPDALIMPGGRWITLGAIRALEERFGKPVITNYSAGLWAALRGAGYSRPIHGWGMLAASVGEPAQ